MTDTEAMEAIKELLSGTEWDASIPEYVADYVRLTGRVILPPMPHEDFADTVLEHYIIAALWSSTVGEEGTPMDDDYGPDDLAPEAIQEMRSDIENFLHDLTEGTAAGTLLDQLQETPYGDEHGLAERIGHDFWLTRNGHGVGFWDRGLGELGDELTKAAKAHGSVDLYIGDDGRIYQ